MRAWVGKTALSPSPWTDDARDSSLSFLTTHVTCRWHSLPRAGRTAYGASSERANQNWDAFSSQRYSIVCIASVAVICGRRSGVGEAVVLVVAPCNAHRCKVV